MSRLVTFVLLGSMAACFAAPRKVDPQQERGSSGHSYNVAHIGHRGGGSNDGNTGYSDDDDDRDYPGGGTHPGGGGYNYPHYPHRSKSNRVRRNYEGEYGYGGHRYGRHGYSSRGHGPIAYIPLQTQSNSYSKASASSSSGSGGGHYGR